MNDIDAFLACLRIVLADATARGYRVELSAADPLPLLVPDGRDWQGCRLVISVVGSADYVAEVARIAQPVHLSTCTPSAGAG